MSGMIAENKLHNYLLMLALGVLLDELDVDIEKELGEEKIRRLDAIFESLNDAEDEQTEATKSLAIRMLHEAVARILADESKEESEKEAGDPGEESAT